MKKSKKQLIGWALAALLTGSPVLASDLNLRLEGDKVWLTANDQPLIDVLKAFSDLSVNVTFDPTISRDVSVNLKNEDVSDAMDRMLGDLGYVLTWKLVKGPVGRIIRLSELQVFNQGEKDKAKPLVAGRRNFDVRKSKDGSFEYIADELLIGMKAKMTKKEFLEFLKTIGAVPVDGFPEIGIYRLKLPPGTDIEELVKKLTGDDRVAVAEPNYAYRVPPGFQDIGGVENLPITGADIPAGMAPVAVFDSGVMSLAGLNEAVVGSFDAVHPGQPVTDNQGHGTQMAMIASGAVPPRGTGGKGGTATVPVLAIRAFDDRGVTSNDTIFKGIQYALRSNSKVMTMSFGSGKESQVLGGAIRYAHNNDMVVVASAGNEPTGQKVWPAAFKEVIAVSATTRNGEIWKNSNYGSFVHMSAPGTASFSVGYRGPPGGYAGTSISAAYVGGQVANFRQANPNLNSGQVIRKVTGSLTDNGSRGYDTRFGHGTLDNGAVRRLFW
ncbi:MAG: S8 family serine peptidase [Verrucomicrobiota bacterium]